MECYCDYDGPTSPDAALLKPQLCSECRQPAIQPGQTYQDVFGVWDGEASTFNAVSFVAIPGYVTALCPASAGITATLWMAEGRTAQRPPKRRGQGGLQFWPKRALPHAPGQRQ